MLLGLSVLLINTKNKAKSNLTSKLDKPTTHLTDYCEMVKKHNERELARKEYERQE